MRALLWKNFTKKINPENALILVILLSGFFLRYLFVFHFHPPEEYIYSDMQGYIDRAYYVFVNANENIYNSFYPPATHYVYSLFFFSDQLYIGLKWFNILISTITCLIIYRTTLRLFGKTASIIALSFSSFNYLFIDFCGYVLSETLFTFSLALMFWFFIESILAEKIFNKRLYAFLAGFAIIASASVKSSVLLFLPLYGIWWLFNSKKHKLYFNLPFYALGFLPLCIILMIRFHNLTGDLGIVSTNGGFNFFQGRSHIKDLNCFDEVRGTYYMFASPVAVQKNYTYNDTFYTGPYDSKFFYRKGLELVKADPWLSIKYSVQHIGDLFVDVNIWPSSAIKMPFPALINFFNILSFIIIIIPAILIVIMRFRYLWSNVALLVTFPLLVIILTSAVYYGDPRFRVPFDVFFIILASWFYSESIKKLKKEKSIK